MTPLGEVLPIPRSRTSRRFEAGYNYCVQNWCLRSAVDTFFTYMEGSFSEYYHCEDPFDPTVQNAVLQEVADEGSLTDICGMNIACLVDGVVGDETDALAFLNDLETSNEFRIDNGGAIGPQQPPRKPRGPHKGKGKWLEGKGKGYKGKWKGYKGKGKGMSKGKKYKGKEKGHKEKVRQLPVCRELFLYCCRVLTR